MDLGRAQPPLRFWPAELAPSESLAQISANERAASKRLLCARKTITRTQFDDLCIQTGKQGTGERRSSGRPTLAAPKREQYGRSIRLICLIAGWRPQVRVRVFALRLPPPMGLPLAESRPELGGRVCVCVCVRARSAGPLDWAARGEIGAGRRSRLSGPRIGRASGGGPPVARELGRALVQQEPPSAATLGRRLRSH